LGGILEFFLRAILILSTILAIRNFKKRTANSRSRAFAAVRSSPQPFAVVRRRSPMIKNLKKTLIFGQNKVLFPKKLHTKIFQENFFYL
jgi:hypothetical protein